VLSHEPGRERKGEVQSHHQVPVSTGHADEKVDGFVTIPAILEGDELPVAGQADPDMPALPGGRSVP
jgi:hypothetical protein